MRLHYIINLFEIMSFVTYGHMSHYYNFCSLHTQGLINISLAIGIAVDVDKDGKKISFY